MTKEEEIHYFNERKTAYEYNLKNGIGHKQSIEKIINEIDKKINFLIRS